MELVRVRKFHLVVEEIRHEFGPPPPRPTLKGAVCAVIHNPYAGRYEPDITPMIEALPNLRKLDLRWNKLRSLPDWLQRLEQQGCTVYLSCH